MNEADKGKTTLTEGMKATATGLAAGYRESPCHDCYCWRGKCTRSKRLWNQCAWKSDYSLFVPRPKQSPIKVVLNFGLDTCKIEHIQLIEKQLDAALLSAGYTRSESSKCADQVTFNYWQMAIIER